MNITIITIGTRGDVQPYIALACGLQAAGHVVTLCTHPTYAVWVTEHGIGYAPLAGDIRALLTTPQGSALLSQRNPARLMHAMTELVRPLLRDMMRDIIAAAEGADLLLGSTLAYFIARTAAEVHRVPVYLAGLQWFSPTAAFPAAALPVWPRGLPGAAVYNRLSYRAANRAVYAIAGKALNSVRRELTGLPPLQFGALFDQFRQMRQPVIYGLSRFALPPAAEWNQHVHATGFWFLDRPTWTPPPGLTEFLAAGPPPVYVGFGSMSDQAPAQLAATVVTALVQAGQRGILAAGWGGIQAAALPPTVFPLAEAPHEWLFPRMAAVVHHGGVGTTSRALAAGVPQVVVPFSSDQPFWGEQLRRLGVGTAPIPRKQVTAARLAAAIATATGTDRMRERAQSLGIRVQAEDGVGTAVRLIEALSPHCSVPATPRR